MTKLLEEAIEKLRKMPDIVQDLAAGRLLSHVDDMPELDELEAIAEGRRALERGEAISLDQWSHDVELGDR